MPKSKRDAGHDAGGDAGEQPSQPESPAEPEAEAQSDEAARLNGLLADLAQLQVYLDERGAHTYELAQRFMAYARRDPSSGA